MAALALVGSSAAAAAELSTSLPTSAPQPSHAGSLTFDDCDSLFRAIEYRLRKSVADTAVGADAGLVRRAVLECADALERLHQNLADERLRYGLLDNLAADVERRLAQALAELAMARNDEGKARHLALHDGLTSLPNRSHFRQVLDSALRTAVPGASNLAVLYLDLDDMKAVNDTHGHCVGDQLLMVVAARLARAVRSTDMCSRQGGDEFALLMSAMPDWDQVGRAVGDMAGKLFDAVAAPVLIGTLTLQVRASIGIALCPDHGTAADELIRNADAAMYYAKREQSRYAFFDNCDSR